MRSSWSVLLKPMPALRPGVKMSGRPRSRKVMYLLLVCCSSPAGSLKWPIRTVPTTGILRRPPYTSLKSVS